jgi:hypothetical protein
MKMNNENEMIYWAFIISFKCDDIMVLADIITTTAELNRYRNSERFLCKKSSSSNKSIKNTRKYEFQQ